MAMTWYSMPSKYATRMLRLKCKIFGEYFTPPSPPELVANPNQFVLHKWQAIHGQNQRQAQRQAALPLDLDPDRNGKYYPPHPQIRSLMHVLRLHGLYRDEHFDFVDEMKRLRALRGKRLREKGGKSGKRAQFKD